MNHNDSKAINLLFQTKLIQGCHRRLERKFGNPFGVNVCQTWKHIHLCYDLSVCMSHAAGAQARPFGFLSLTVQTVLLRKDNTGTH